MGRRLTEQADLKTLFWRLSTLIDIHSCRANCSGTCRTHHNSSVDTEGSRATCIWVFECVRSSSICMTACLPASVILWCHRDESRALSSAFLPSSSSAASAEKNLGLLQCHPACLLYAVQACSACLTIARCSLQGLRPSCLTAAKPAHAAAKAFLIVRICVGSGDTEAYGHWGKSVNKVPSAVILPDRNTKITSLTILPGHMRCI